MLFRVQEFLLGQPWAPWTDLLRVDILNMMGISMMAMGALCRVARTRTATVIASAAVSLAIALATPPLWTTLRPRWLPWPRSGAEMGDTLLSKTLALPIYPELTEEMQAAVVAAVAAAYD